MDKTSLTENRSCTKELSGKRTPVALFSYNRPLHTDRALEALSKCSRREECDFYFFLDGPRTQDIRPQVEATLKVLNKWKIYFKAHVIQRDENLGLAKSIVSGVTELCNRYGQVIVVEDDLVVEQAFLHFMIESLYYYENEEKVSQVGGFTVSSPENLSTDAFLLPVTTTWGWATWQRAWKHFSWTPDNLDKAMKDNEWCQLFNLSDTCAFFDMLKDRLAGRNDSWGILWWYAVSRNRGLVVYPKTSLVWNGGFDGSGIHCGAGDYFNQNKSAPKGDAASLKTVTFPPITTYEKAHLIQLEDFFRSRSNNKQPEKFFRGLGGKLARLVQRLIR